MPGFVRRIVVGISGSSSPIYGIRALEALRTEGSTEIHLIITSAARRVIELETGWKLESILSLAHELYGESELAAGISSGSFHTDGMIVAPCSMRSLAEIAHGISTNLLTRAADVHLKERRRLVLMVRETPLSLVHLRNMTAVTEAGAVVLPPIPAFYHHPKTIDDLINHSVGKALDIMSIPHRLFDAWEGPRSSGG
jgi:polyprenyl P-hydroxybenzoate/phenylacrylic acid decarboxylase-like protein